LRRASHLFDKIVDRDNLRLAVHKALKGKRSKTDAREFVQELDANLNDLRHDLLAGGVAVGEYRQFTIFDPKERLITAPCFRERVLHHATISVCEPIFERWLISDTFACRQGKGRLAALNRARVFAGRQPVFLKLDIRKYFDSVSHQILVARLERLFKDRRLLALLWRIVACYKSAPGCGLPIGSLTSQHFANFYLGWFDRFVKEQLGVKGYVRYMDDCALWGGTTAQLQQWLTASAAFLREELALDLKPEPYRNHTSHGMDFLGCRIFPNRIELNRRSRVRFRRKLLALELDYQAGRLDEPSLQERATAMVAFARSPGVSSWQYRRSALESMPVSDQ